MTVYETSYLDPPWILSFDHVVLLSWWQFKRFFNKSGTSVVCKPLADVVVVHPAPRFTTAENRQKWEEACRWALLAYCNHGAKSKDTFADKVQLEGLSTEEQQELMDKFIFTAPDNRQQQRLTQCPPHIRKKYLRGLARLVRMEKRIHTHDTVTASMREIKFVFTDEET